MALTKATYGMISADTSTIDLNIDANTLYVDSSANRVGIGTNSPTNKLEIKADSGHLRLQGATTTTKGLALLFDNTNNRCEIRSDQAGVNQLDLQYYALNHKFGRNASLITMTLTDTGEVGIGTTSPSTLLELRTDTASSGYGDYPALTIRNDNAAGYGAIHFNEGSTQRARVEVGNNSGTPYMGLYTTSGSSGITIKDGKVGIGHSAPYFPLHVHGPTGFNGEAKNNILAFDSASATTGTGGGIAFGGYTNGTGGDVYHFGNIQGIKENSTAGNYASAMLFSTRANGATPLEQMRISSTGNVGIGTSSPQDKLHVYDGDVGIENSSGRRYRLIAEANGAFTIRDQTAAAGRLAINTSGIVSVSGGLETTQTVAKAVSLAGTYSGGNYIEWKKGGAAEFYIGSSNTVGSGSGYYDLYAISGYGQRFFTGAAERMRITSDGKVGIGTTSVDEKLQVEEGNIKIEGGSNNTARELIFAHTGYTGNQTILEQRMPGGPYGRLHTTQRKLIIEAGSGGGTGTGEKLEFWTNASRAMTIDTSQNVGIGTSSPATNLDVYNGSGWGQARLDGTSGGELLFAKAGTSYGNMYASDSHGLVIQAMGGTNTLGFRTNGAERMRIDSSGKVGIANTTPSNNHANANNLVVGNGSAGGIANYVGTGLGWYAFSRDNANNTDAYDGGMSYDGSRNLMFHTNAGAERMRIDGAGNVGVGLTPKTGFSNDKTLQALGPIGSGKSAGTYSPSDPRTFRDWFVYAGPTSGINRYVHMKTDLWAGGSPAGNTEYTMSVFKYHSAYSYGNAKVSEGMIAWHNWSGSTAHQRIVHNPVSNWAIVKESYTSSDGYVVLVADILASGSYCCFSIDWHQWAGYTLRNRKVTAVTQNASATGAY